METHICRTNKQPFYLQSPLHRTKSHQNFALPLTRLSFKLKEKPKHRLCLSPRMNHGLVSGCAKCGSGSVAELERELEAEMNQEGEDWIMEMGKLREKCKERKGMVELLECLEREAIMGEDEGREASDYSRRARIFDKSSIVFAALKERTTPSQQS